MTQNIALKDDHITLGQLLKHVSIISSGGEAKVFLNQHEIMVNGERETRRGRKLRENDVVTFDENTFRIVR